MQLSSVRLFVRRFLPGSSISYVADDRADNGVCIFATERFKAMNKLTSILTALILLTVAAPAVADTKAADSGKEWVKIGDVKWSPCSFDTFTRKVFVTVEAHASFFSDAEDRHPLGDSFGYDVKAGYRFGRFGVFFQFEHNLWITSEYESGVAQGVVNLGIGLEVNYLKGYARSAISIGPSVLLFDTGIDEAGNTGLYLDVRPIGLRWPIKPFFAIVFDPMSFSLVAPAFDRVPLVMMQFRTTIGFEFVM